MIWLLQILWATDADEMVIEDDRDNFSLELDSFNSVHVLHREQEASYCTSTEILHAVILRILLVKVNGHLECVLTSQTPC